VIISEGYAMSFGRVIRRIVGIVFLVAAVFGMRALYHAQYRLSEQNEQQSEQVTSEKTVEDIRQEAADTKKAALPKTIVETPFDVHFQVSEASFSDKTAICDITKYGAVGDGKTKNTEAFVKAIDDCYGQGGGQVFVPAGVWLTGPIHLKSDIDLHVDKGATILFSTDLSDYLPVVFSRFEGVEYYNYSPPIYAKNCVNVAITGEGTINGQAEKSWWNFNIMSSDIPKLYAMGQDGVSVDERIFGTAWTGLRPGFIEFVDCDAVRVEGVTIKNGPMWTIHPIYSEDVVVRNVKVLTAPGRSTDGFVADSSRNVLVEHSTFSTGDDSIVIKSGRNADGIRVNKPSENIVIRDCNILETHAAVAIGSEVSGGIRNIFVENITMKNGTFGARIKSSPGRQGFVENVWINGVTVTGSTSDALIALDNLYEVLVPPSDSVITPFTNIHFSGFSARKAKSPLFIRGYDRDSVKDIFVDDMTVKANNSISISDVSGLTIRNMKAHSFRNKGIIPVVKIKNSDNVRFEASGLTDANISCVGCTYSLSAEVSAQDETASGVTASAASISEETSAGDTTETGSAY
jgi:hypothetical protein